MAEPTVKKVKFNAKNGNRLNPNELTEDYRCGYCLQTWLRMTDPRQLPCSHVFCLPCLQDEDGSYHSTENLIRCQICRKAHNIDNLQDLPKPTLLEPLPQPPVAERCDVCEEKHEEAVVFCLECEKKLCQEHHEVHKKYNKAFQNRTHKTISIDVYSSKPNLYKSVKCSKHPDVKLQLACSECYKTFCMECETGWCCEPDSEQNFERCCDTYSTHEAPHILQPLSKTKEKVKARLTGLLNSLSSRMSELCRSEKVAWHLVTEVEDEVRDMKQNVEQLRRKKIAAIRRESDELMADIDDYLLRSSGIVERFTAKLVQKRENMDELWKSTRWLMTSCHDSELVEKYTKQKDTLKASLSPHSDLRRLESRALVPLAVPMADGGKYFNLQLVSIPSHMKLVAAVRDDKSWVHSVNISQSETLICGTSNGAQTRYFETLRAEPSTGAETCKASCFDIIQPVDAMFAAQEGSRASVGIFTIKPNNLQVDRMIFKANAPRRSYCRIAQCGTDIYLIYYSNKLHIHSLISESDTTEHAFPVDNGRPFAIYVLPDGTILIGDFNETLTRYSLNRDEGLDLIWTLDVPAWAISYDAATGLIYSASMSGMSLVSTDGQLIKKLPWVDLKSATEERIIDMVVFNGHVVLACQDHGLVKFKFQY